MNGSAFRAALVLAALAAPAAVARGENYGRVTLPHEVVVTSVYPAGDSDDLVFDAAAGWKVQATLKVLGQVQLPPPPEGEDPPVLTPLAPVLELVGPSGAVVTEGVGAKAAKKSASLRALLAEGGRFAIRVRGSAGTGAVSVKWKLTPAKVAPVRKMVLPPESETEFPFAARGGALLSWTLSFKGDGAAQVKEILDADGIVVPFDPNDGTYVTRKLTSEKVTKFPLPAGLRGGMFRLVVENDLFPSTVNLTVKVAMPRLPPLTRTLTMDEPALYSISNDRSACGVTVGLAGQNLDPAPQGIFFGPKGATAVDVTPGATAADPDEATCDVPGGSGTVDVVFVSSDGQVAVLPQAFTFNPPPTIESFEPVVGPGVGNIEMTLHGSGFETGGQDLYDVLVGGSQSDLVQSSLVRVVDESTITCRVPAHVAGPKRVILRNRCGEDVVAPGTFTYTSSLNISSVVPPAVPVDGNVPVTIYGTGFLGTNSVFLDGNAVASTPVSFQGTVIGHAIPAAAVPPHPPGKVEVKVTQGGAQAVRPAGLAYYTFTDATATAIPPATSIDDWGGVSTAVFDADADGVVDYLVITNDVPLSMVRPGTRILKNNGSGVFTDVTATAMPETPEGEDYSGNQVLAGRFNGDSYPDLFLSRPGTGDEARRTSDGKFVDAWARLLLFDGTSFSNQVSKGSDSKFSIPGILTYTKCYVFDFDFRSVAAASGDLDGDLDLDVALVNDTSIKWFKGTNCTYAWQTCAGGYYTACYSAITYDVGSALRMCTMSSSGTVFDRTAEMLASTFSAADDFRGVAVAVGDMNGDFLNDIVVTHDRQPGPSGTVSCTRAFRQLSSGVSVTYAKLQAGFFPSPSSAADDDWRGVALAIPDLNGDLYRDVVVALDSAVPNGRTFSTRILVQDTSTGKLVDRTDALLTDVLPPGDFGRAKFVLGRDIDRDGDADLILSTPTTAGAGNRMTRYLLNVGKDASGLPILRDSSGLLPAYASDQGNAVSVLAADIDGDGDSDLIVTDTHGAVITRRTRVWKQDR